MGHKLAMIFSTFALCCCLDIDLADELNWPDGNLPRDGSSGADAGEDDRIDGNVNGDGGLSWPDGSNPDGAVLDTTPPWLVPAAGCGPAESLLGSLCTSSGAFGIGLRFWVSEPVVASASFEPDGGLVRDDQLDVEHHLLLAPLASERDFEITIEVVDTAELSAVEGPLTIRTAPSIEPVVINEVLFDPLGAEPQQEFVEIYNLGSDVVDLSGWIIADEGGSDAMTPSTVLQAGGYAVIVSEGYQPSAGGDPPPAAGALMIRLSGSIGSQGLRNSGESLTLSDASGQVIASAPAPTSPTGPGISVERSNPYAPDGDPANWLPNSAGSSTPGSRNSVTEPP